MSSDLLHFVGAAERCDLLIWFLKQNQKIAAFRSSYTGQLLLNDG
jgi:hypothetical protein